MDRQIVYPGAIPLETDLLNTNKNVQFALGQFAQDVLGTSALFTGLSCVPNSPAAMNVIVNPGAAYARVALDATAYSSLSADAFLTVKQGILKTAQTFNTPAPTTAGQSINYLISAAFVEGDTNLTVLPYYNAGNPSQAYAGPSNNGSSQATTRQCTVQLTLTAGTPAATGSQVTPATPSGQVALYVVTVAYGASSVIAGNIATASGAPFLGSSMLSMLLMNGTYCVATGTANAHVIAPTPPVAARTDGMVLKYKAPAANTGALTVNDGLGAVAVVGSAHAALQGGEVAANGDVWLQWNASIGGGSYVMLDSTGGAQQLAAGSYGVTPAQFDNSTKLPTTAFLASMLGNLGTASSVSIASFPYNITAAQMGSMLAVNGTGTVNLPNATGFPPGTTVMFYSASAFTLAAAGGQFLASSPGSAAVSTVSIPAVSTAYVTWNGGAWLVTISGAAVASIGGSSGYVKIPTLQGRAQIIQWGGFTGSASGDTPVTFPIAFPTGFRLALVSGLCSGTGAWGGYNSPTASGMNCNWWSASGTRQSGSGTYIAIGD